VLYISVQRTYIYICVKEKIGSNFGFVRLRRIFYTDTIISLQRTATQFVHSGVKNRKGVDPEVLAESENLQVLRSADLLFSNDSRFLSVELKQINKKYYTGWRRPIGCLELLVIFRKRATNYRALLRKMTCTDKAFYGSSSPLTRRRLPRLKPLNSTSDLHRGARAVGSDGKEGVRARVAAPHCNTLQHTVTHCNTLKLQIAAT